MAIFGGGKPVEPQYKKIFKKRISQTGMSEVLREIDKDFSNYDYTQVISDLKRPSTIPAAQGWAEKLGKASKSIRAIYQGKKIAWSTEEDKFLKKLLEEIDKEQTDLKKWIEKANNDKEKSEEIQSDPKVILNKLNSALKSTAEWKSEQLKNGDEFATWEERLGIQYKTITENTLDVDEDVPYFTTLVNNIEKAIEDAKSKLAKNERQMRMTLDPLYSSVPEAHKKNVEVKKALETLKKEDKSITVTNSALSERVKEAREKIKTLRETFNSAGKKKKK